MGGAGQPVSASGRASGRGLDRERPPSLPWHGYDYDPLTGGSPGEFVDEATCFPLELRNGDVYVAVERAHRVPRNAAAHPCAARVRGLRLETEIDGLRWMTIADDRHRSIAIVVRRTNGPASQQRVPRNSPSWVIRLWD
jgi:hypothetical protein